MNIAPAVSETFRTLDHFEHAVNDYITFSTEPVDLLCRVRAAPPGRVFVQALLHLPTMPGHGGRLMSATVPISDYLQWEIPDFLEIRDFQLSPVDLQILISDARKEPRP